MKTAVCLAMAVLCLLVVSGCVSVPEQVLHAEYESQQLKQKPIKIAVVGNTTIYKVKDVTPGGSKYHYFTVVDQSQQSGE